VFLRDYWVRILGNASIFLFFLIYCFFGFTGYLGWVGFEFGLVMEFRLAPIRWTTSGICARVDAFHGRDIPLLFRGMAILA
jgi:hypothetical protein